MTYFRATDASVTVADAGASGSMNRDLVSAYVVSAARIGAWAGISALVFREFGAYQFALLALIRGTIGLLGYTSLGLGPAMVRALAQAARPLPASAVPETPDAAETAMPRSVLGYAAHGLAQSTDSPTRVVYASGERVAMASAVAGTCLSIVYSVYSTSLHVMPDRLFNQAAGAAVCFGFGMSLRVMGEAPASLLQVRGRIALDNYLIAASEVLWFLASASILFIDCQGVVDTALAFLIASVFLLSARNFAAVGVDPQLTWPRARSDSRIIRSLLGFGLGVTVAQAADYLYAPTDYILINRLLGPWMVAVYAPAVQIDAGLLVLVTGLAAVLLPRSAMAHAAGDRATVRRYYLRGTLASLALLTPAAAVIWLISPLLLRMWLGSPFPETLTILPLVLVSTVVGGSSAVGRSILLAMGRVKPFAISVLTAGATNAILSYVFARYLGWGLRGIIYGTMVAVFGRCAVWMPWYVLRTLKAEEIK